MGSASDGLLQPGDKIGITKLTSIFPRIEKKRNFYLKMMVSQKRDAFARSIQLSVTVRLWLSTTDYSVLTISYRHNTVVDADVNTVKHGLFGATN